MSLQRPGHVATRWLCFRRVAVPELYKGPASVNDLKKELPDASSPCDLVVKGVSKHFGGVFALRDASISCEAGEIVGLIGPNGAGKTTLVNLIAGLMSPDDGEIWLGDVRLDGRPSHDVARRGVARTFQNVRLFGRLTVHENVLVAATTAMRHREGGPEAMSVLLGLGIESFANRRAGDLAHGHQRLVEIARALALAPNCLLLDELAAGMSEAESEELIQTVRRIRSSTHCGVIVIDHDLPFVMGISDRIYVLNEGSVIAHGSPTEVQGNQTVREVYLGRPRGGRADSASDPVL